METIILSNLVNNEEYMRKVLPYLQNDYFSDGNQVVFDLINTHIQKYNQLPSEDALFVGLQERTNLNQMQFENARNVISTLNGKEKNVQWLTDQTEKFCQEKALYNAIRQSIQVIDGKSTVPKGGLPEMFQKALQVSFDNTVGHDFIEDTEKRWDLYTKEEYKIPFDIELLNIITKGGIPGKSLVSFISPSGGGKTLVMCHCAAHNLMCSKNVLYITLEMAEERIAQRIDVNLLDVSLDEIELIPKASYDKKMARVKETTKGKLIIKEYPTASVGVNHFRHLLNELKLKKNFTPDIVYIDYINLCLSSRFKFGASINSYSYIKAIAEELRGLAVEFNLPIITATQANRSAYGSSDVDMENTSDSIGLVFTLDMMIGIVTTPELTALNQVMFKQLKNRFGDINKNTRFIVGVDRPKMRLYNVDQSAQQGLLGQDDDVSVFDNSNFGTEEAERKKPKSKRFFDKKAFEGFN